MNILKFFKDSEKEAEMFQLELPAELFRFKQPGPSLDQLLQLPKRRTTERVHINP